MFGSSQLDSFSGGGFISSQDADPSRTFAKSRDSPPLLPLTVKQISQAIQSSDEKSNFVIDGVDVNNVRLVGMAYKKSERVTDVAFAIDDGTGRIECIRWGYTLLILRASIAARARRFLVVPKELKHFRF
ncbi:hypothetical protein P3S67_010076 [Capsicum chacoense]